MNTEHVNKTKERIEEQGYSIDSVEVIGKHVYATISKDGSSKEVKLSMTKKEGEEMKKLIGGSK